MARLIGGRREYQISFRVLRQNQRRARMLIKIEVPDKVAELWSIFSHVGTWIGSSIGFGTNALTVSCLLLEPLEWVQSRESAAAISPRCVSGPLPITLVALASAKPDGAELLIIEFGAAAHATFGANADRSEQASTNGRSV